MCMVEVWGKKKTKNVGRERIKIIKLGIDHDFLCVIRKHYAIWARCKSYSTYDISSELF